MTQHLITTTMQPDRVVEVSDEELTDLERMGVVASHVPSDLSQVPAPTPLVGKTKSGGTDGGSTEAQGQPEADGVEEEGDVGK